jgi:tetratricopeptide (TPR) repeat protein
MDRQTLQLRETVLGKEHPSTLLSMNNLAASLGQQGKYAEAEAMNRQTLRLQEAVLGKEHPSTLDSMNNLANSLRQQGKHAEAEAMYQLWNGSQQTHR